MPERKYTFSTDVGKHLVIMITGEITFFIAEVTQKDPLILKVKERGHFAHLRNDDYTIIHSDSEQIQDEGRSTALFKGHADNGHPLVSGLKSLGIENNELCTIVPVPEEV